MQNDDNNKKNKRFLRNIEELSKCLPAKNATNINQVIKERRDLIEKRRRERINHKVQEQIEKNTQTTIQLDDLPPPTNPQHRKDDQNEQKLPKQPKETEPVHNEKPKLRRRKNEKLSKFVSMVENSNTTQNQSNDHKSHDLRHVTSVEIHAQQNQLTLPETNVSNERSSINQTNVRNLSDVDQPPVIPVVSVSTGGIYIKDYIKRLIDKGILSDQTKYLNLLHTRFETILKYNIEKLTLFEKRKFLVNIGDVINKQEFPNMIINIRVVLQNGNVKEYHIRNIIDDLIVDTEEQFQNLYKHEDADGNPVIQPLESIVEVEVSIRPINDKHVRRKMNGNFFPYFLNRKCSELREYMATFEIFSEENWIPSENCFYMALVNWNKNNTQNIIPEDTLRKIKYRLTGNGVKKSLIKKISEDFGLYIHLRTFCLNGTSFDTENTREEHFGHINALCHIDLGLIMIDTEGHYFPNITTKFTEAGITHYFELKMLYGNKNFIDYKTLEERIGVNTVKYKENGISPVWNSRCEKRYLKAHVMIEKMLKYNSNGNVFFVPIPNSQFYRGLVSHSNCSDINNININLNECRLIERKEKYIDNVVFVADTECSINDRHIPYAISYCKLGEDDKMKTFLGKNCIKDFITNIDEQVKTLTNPIDDKKNKRDKKVVVYFHNLSYDGRMFVDCELYSVKMNSNKIIEMKIFLPSRNILILRDSLMLISTKLANFPSMFKTKEKCKKVFPYSFVSLQSIEVNQYVDIEEIIRSQPWNDYEIDEFRNTLNDDGCIDFQGMVDVRKMVTCYVESDVRILSQGMTTFSDDIKRALGLNLCCYLSISSLAFDYLKKNAFEGENIYEYTGELRDFIRRAVYGGRCMTRGNKAYKLPGRIIDDVDACSLYPSAMSIMKIPKGTPKKFESLKYENRANNIFDEDDKRWVETNISNETINGAILRIKIKHIGRVLHFPLICEKNKQGVTEYENFVGGEMVVDDVYFMDMLKWQQIEYDLLEMIYWDEGFSTKINDCIKHIYEERKRAKLNNETIEQVYKLIMNSSYGKCIEKPHKTKVVVVKGENFKSHLTQHYVNTLSINEISTFHDADRKEEIKTLLTSECSDDMKDALELELQQLENNSQYLFNEYVQYDDFFVPSMVGVRILSMSKKLMNQVMVPAEIHGIAIYYQDTDSMHVESHQLNDLELAWRIENNKSESDKLFGNNLCQFHSDFDKIDGKDSVSIGSIFLAKKMYIDCLKPKDEIDNADSPVVMMTRMKGIPKLSLLSKKLESGAEGNDLLWEIYDGLFQGQSFNFELVCNRTKIQFTKNLEVRSLYSFVRTANAPRCQHVEYNEVLGDEPWVIKDSDEIVYKNVI